MNTGSSTLIFGASGSIGGACFNLMSQVSSAFTHSHSDTEIGNGAPYDSVIWAQGLNKTEGFLTTPEESWEEILEANLHFVRRSVEKLVKGEFVIKPASFVFVGSVWGRLARQDKSAYVVSKSALEGLTKSLAIDLAPHGIRVNSVLPGVVDNPMTRSNLSEDQIKKIEIETPGQKLVTPENVAHTVRFLCSGDSIGINGQSIVLDNGWSIARYI